MQGWIVPPPKTPTKSEADFERERLEKVSSLTRHGYLKSDRVRQALLKVHREEIDPVTFAFAKRNLQTAGYDDVVLVNADGGLGHPELAPFDRVSVTAACHEIPPPLIAQLGRDGKLIAPVTEHGTQVLVLLEKVDDTLQKTVLCEVLYMSLRGTYGAVTANGI